MICAPNTGPSMQMGLFLGVNFHTVETKMKSIVNCRKGFSGEKKTQKWPDFEGEKKG
jgi:hypothetical protein